MNRNLIIVSIVSLAVALGACSATPPRPLSPAFETEAKSTSFLTLVNSRFREDPVLRAHIANFEAKDWVKNTGGSLVYRLSFKTDVELAGAELDNMLSIFCRARGLAAPAAISVPLFSTDRYGGSTYNGSQVQGTGCGTDSKVMAAYVFDGYSRDILRIYSNEDSVAVLDAKKAEHDAAVATKLAKKREWRAEQTKRLRVNPQPNEMVNVNLSSWNLEKMAGFELMDVRIARSGAIFEGRVRDIKPPVVLIENARFVGLPRVWVPMEALESPPHGTPFD